MAVRSKRPRSAGASKKLPKAGRAGTARAVADHRRAEERDARSKATFDLPAELMDELRIASAMLGETLGEIAARGLAAELQRLRDESMGGKPFPMPVKARKGRPRK